MEARGPGPLIISTRPSSVLLDARTEGDFSGRRSGPPASHASRLILSEIVSRVHNLWESRCTSWVLMIMEEVEIHKSSYVLDSKSIKIVPCWGAPHLKISGTVLWNTMCHDNAALPNLLTSKEASRAQYRRTRTSLVGFHAGI